MKKLCFGSYMTVLKLCKAKGVTQKSLCGTVLLSIAPNYDIRGEDVTVSDLLKCKKGLSGDVTSVAPTADTKTTTEYFKLNVLPMLDGNKIKNAVLALRSIISSDNGADGIKNDTIVDRVSELTKSTMLDASSFVAEDFLAGVFLYTATSTDHKDGQASIRDVNADFVNSFDTHHSDITLTDKSNAARTTALSVFNENVNTEAATEIASGLIRTLTPLLKPDNSLLITLLTESNGNCLRCGNALGISKKGATPLNNCGIVYLKKSTAEIEDYDNAVVLCTACIPYVPRMAVSEKDALLDNKKRLAADMIVLDEVSGIRIAKEIETVLREVDSVKNEPNLPETKITELVEIEKKINELYLRNKINANMVRLFKTVRDICSRLEQEIGFDTERFGRAMKFIFEMVESEIIDRTDIVDPQNYIESVLTENLYNRIGQKYKAACEIIVAYLIKRCDLFNENAK